VKHQLTAVLPSVPVLTRTDGTVVNTDVVAVSPRPPSSTPDSVLIYSAVVYSSSTFNSYLRRCLPFYSSLRRLAPPRLLCPHLHRVRLNSVLYHTPSPMPSSGILSLSSTHCRCLLRPCLVQSIYFPPHPIPMLSSNRPSRLSIITAYICAYAMSSSSARHHLRPPTAVVIYSDLVYV